jgi:hypothetical protein
MVLKISATAHHYMDGLRRCETLSYPNLSLSLTQQQSRSVLATETLYLKLQGTIFPIRKFLITLNVSFIICHNILCGLHTSKDHLVDHQRTPQLEKHCSTSATDGSETVPSRPVTV